MDKPDTALFMGATPEQVSTLVSHLSWYTSPGWIRRAPDAKLIADLVVYHVAGGTLGSPGQQRKAYDYAHELRRELSRRKLMPVPDMRIPRCEVCHHGTERLFATSEATHNIVSSNDEEKRIFPNLCVRCWDRLHTDSNETEET
jgi:hypothetical protein